MPAVTGSEHGDSFIYVILRFCFLFLCYFLLLQLVLVWIRLVTVVFPQTRLCLPHENDIRLVVEIASTINNGIDRLR